METNEQPPQQNTTINEMDIEEESPSPNNPPSPDYDPTYPTYTKTTLRDEKKHQKFKK